MRAGGGHKKGAEFERVVSKLLSLWISKDERDDLLWRSAMSGGRATLSLKKGKVASSQAGDVVSTHYESSYFIENFMVELKFYKDLYFESLIFSNRRDNSIYGFWNKLVKESKKYKKHPILIAKQNHKPIIVLTNKPALRLLNLDNLESRYSYFADPSCYLMLLSDFIETAELEDFR